MTIRTLFLLAVLVVIPVAMAAYVLTRPDPVPQFSDGLGDPIDCTTCDARQKAKKRLSDHLQSKAEE